MDGTSHRILVIDDDPDMLAQITGILEAAVCAVVTATTDCEEARGLLRTTSFDLVAMRHCHSAVDGHDMLTGTLSHIGSTPYIAITDENDWEAAATALENGASGFVETGGRLRSGLVSAVIEAIEKERQTEMCTRTERALKESEELYRTIVEMSPDVILVTDVEANITNVSHKTLEMFGFSNRGEIVGHSGFEFFAQEDRERASTNFQRRFGNGELGYQTYTFLRSDGSSFLGELNVAPFRNDRGEIKGVMAILRDVTSSKAIEEELRRCSEKLEATLHALPDLMFEVDRQGRIYEYRAPASDLLYARPEEFVGNKVDEVIPADAARVIMDAVEEAALTGKHRRGIYSLDLPSGRRWFELTIQSRGGPDRRDCRMVALVRDITERKKVESALKDSEKDLFDRPLTEENIADIKELMGTIERNVSRSQSLVQGLLSNAEAGRKPAQTASIDVASVVVSAMKDSRQAIEEAGLEVRCDPYMGHLEANHTHIYQLFANLISNTIKYNDGEDPVLVISYLGEGTEGQKRYMVKDNGPGISAGMKDRIFQPFVSGRPGETGMGLSIVRKMVETYGGTISAYNDGGACFEFSLFDYPGA